MIPLLLLAACFYINPVAAGFSPTELKLVELINKLKKSRGHPLPSVKKDQSLSSGHLPAIPNSWDSPDFWGNYRIGAVEMNEDFDAKIQSNPVSVGVIDGGFDVTHPAFKGLIASTNLKTEFNQKFCHGSHVLGTLCGRGPFGVASHSNVKVSLASHQMGKPREPKTAEPRVDPNCRAPTQLDSFQKHLIENLELFDQLDSKANPIRVTSASLSFGQNAGWGEAISEFNQKNDALFVASSGNKGMNIVSSHRGAYDERNGILLVANLSPDNLPSESSNKGNAVFLSAPGTDIFSIDRVPEASDEASTMQIKTEYGWPHLVAKTGTSMAAPFVSGTIAVLLGIHPSLKSQEMVEILKATAIHLGKEGRNREYGYGTVNAYASARMALLMKTMTFDKALAQLKTESARLSEVGTARLASSLETSSQKSFEKAVKMLRKAYFLDPNNPDRKRILFLVQKHLGFKTEARAIALELYSGTREEYWLDQARSFETREEVRKRLGFVSSDLEQLNEDFALHPERLTQEEFEKRAKKLEDSPNEGSTAFASGLKDTYKTLWPDEYLSYCLKIESIALKNSMKNLVSSPQSFSDLSTLNRIVETVPSCQPPHEYPWFTHGELNPEFRNLKTEIQLLWKRLDKGTRQTIQSFSVYTNVRKLFLMAEVPALTQAVPQSKEEGHTSAARPFEITSLPPGAILKKLPLASRDKRLAVLESLPNMIQRARAKRSEEEPYTRILLSLIDSLDIDDSYTYEKLKAVYSLFDARQGFLRTPKSLNRLFTACTQTLQALDRAKTPETKANLESRARLLKSILAKALDPESSPNVGRYVRSVPFQELADIFLSESDEYTAAFWDLKNPEIGKKLMEEIKKRRDHLIVKPIIPSGEMSTLLIPACLVDFKTAEELLQQEVVTASIQPRESINFKLRALSLAKKMKLSNTSVDLLKASLTRTYKELDDSKEAETKALILKEWALATANQQDLKWINSAWIDQFKKEPDPNKLPELYEQIKKTKTQDTLRLLNALLAEEWPAQKRYQIKGLITELSR